MTQDDKFISKAIKKTKTEVTIENGLQEKIVRLHFDGENIWVRQDYDRLLITPDEWPLVRRGINQLLKQHKEAQHE